MEPDYPFKGWHSLNVHGADTPTEAHAHLTPIFATSTFTFDSAEQGMNRFSGKESGYTYSRFGNPTTAAAEQAIARAEAYGLSEASGAPLQLKALLHASGQSAMVTMFLSQLSAGDAVLSHFSLYGGTHEFLYDMAPRLGIRSLIADFRDPAQIETMLRENREVKVVHVETPGNPTMNCIDLEMVATLAHRYGAKLTVDNTFATPALQQPFRYGADFVFHSTTKFLNGHGTSIGGALVGRDIAFMEKQAYRTWKLLGATASPFDAYLLIQGMKTLNLRMQAHCANAQRVAEFLSAHSAVERVHYNGLPDHPGYAISRKQMRLPGAVLSFELKGGLEAGKRFINRLRMCVRAVSLGTVDSLLSHPASMSHIGVSREDRLQAGISDGLIRMSVGLEDAEDILRDLDQALNG